MQLDKASGDSERWSGSSDEKGAVAESVESSSVGGVSFLSDSVVQVVEGSLGESSDESDDGPELLHDLVGVDGLLLGLGLSEDLVQFSEEFDDSGVSLSLVHLAGRVHHDVKSGLLQVLLVWLVVLLSGFGGG